jgi:hypothetical protein
MDDARRFAQHPDQIRSEKMLHLKYVEDQPRWRVAVVATFAKLMGVLIHVEGVPFGSSRSRQKRKHADGAVGATAEAQGQVG